MKKVVTLLKHLSIIKHNKKKLKKTTYIIPKSHILFSVIDFLIYNFISNNMLNKYQILIQIFMTLFNQICMDIYII